MLALGELIKKYKREIFVLIFALIIFIILDIYQSYSAEGLLSVVFFDIGEGDAIFIETPTKKQILIDSGPSNLILDKLGRAMPFYDRYIDLVIATHSDSDHIGGLIDVLKRYKVGTLIMNDDLDNQTLYYQELKRIIVERKIKTIGVLRGSSFLLEPGLAIYIFGPLEASSGVSKEDNENSIVARLVFGKISFLFTADIPKSVEQKLISLGVNLNSDVLKIAHHGSKTSTTENFLSAVSPLLSIISVGPNRYGHPHEETLAKLKNYTFLRTDKEGDIKFLSNGFYLWRE